MVKRNFFRVYLYLFLAAATIHVTGCGGGGGGSGIVPVFDLENQAPAAPATPTGTTPIDVVTESVAGNVSLPVTNDNPATTPDAPPAPPDSTTGDDSTTNEDNTGGTTNPDTVKYVVSGTVFVDASQNAQKDADEPGLQGITVTLKNSQGGVVDTATTDAGGAFKLSAANGNYTAGVDALSGYSSSNGLNRNLTVSNTDTAGHDIGFSLDFAFIGTQTANTRGGGGFWKSNVQKAAQGKTNGVQIDAATLQGYIDAVSTLALSPLNVNTFQEADAILSANGPVAVDKLSRHLLAAELNYVSGGYIGGNKELTEMFINYAEYLILHSDQFTDQQLLQAKDWIEAYNDAGGGQITAP